METAEGWDAVVRFGPAYNRSDRLVVLTPDCHAAVDLMREAVVRICRHVTTRRRGAAVCLGPSGLSLRRHRARVARHDA